MAKIHQKIYSTSRTQTSVASPQNGLKMGRDGFQLTLYDWFIYLQFNIIFSFNLPTEKLDANKMTNFNEDVLTNKPFGLWGNDFKYILM